MKIIERLKEDYAKVKDKPTKEKIGFFWDYYKIPFICIVLVLAFMIQTGVSLANQKKIVFSGVLLNCKVLVKEDPFLDGFYEYAGIDGSEETAAVYSDMLLIKENKEVSLNTIQRILAGIYAKDTDFLGGDAEAFQTCAYHSGEILYNLENFLKPEALEMLSGRLYYADRYIIKEIQKPVGEQVEPDALVYPANPKDPSTMKEPIPVGIDVSDRTAFKEAYYAENEVVFLGVVANTPREEVTRQFLSYLFPEIPAELFINPTEPTVNPTGSLAPA